ncbi:PTS sugar transporter subunit IIA [Halobacterium noricense]|uniref:PTS sugar transporter subunit IIA n=1 Tax=Halobacterium noricense TaxID=223182 RepID=UPI001E58AC38|nr:fructose PTS transporter subunit IIA [Halobacterium noricense]UHH24278.1 fructose PTS transporter subunit IIA [Halobacterium noricense]
MDTNTIESILTTDLTSLSEPPAEKAACIEFLLDLAVDAGRVTDRNAALDALLAREEETTTGVGKGIGIPHTQTEAVDRPTVAFARSEEGIDFGAMDGSLAHLIFMILVPAGGEDEHLSILSSLSRSLMHDEVRDSLYEAESPEEVREVVTEALA